MARPMTNRQIAEKVNGMVRENPETRWPLIAAMSDADLAGLRAHLAANRRLNPELAEIVGLIIERRRANQEAPAAPANRPNTEARWERAAERAVAAGLVARPLGDGRYAVASVSKPGLVYTVTATECQCESALSGDAVCLHRAAVRAIMARTPEPPTPAASAACPVCQGAGIVVKAGVMLPGRTFRATCRECRGSGVAPDSPVLRCVLRTGRARVEIAA